MNYKWWLYKFIGGIGHITKNIYIFKYAAVLVSGKEKSSS